MKVIQPTLSPPDDREFFFVWCVVEKRDPVKVGTYIREVDALILASCFNSFPDAKAWVEKWNPIYDRDYRKPKTRPDLG